ncbi:hypothetical protein MAR_013364 [Mya arenaria]|uniref:Uncharacterized protein n=1 Tax=Mya arenaria TaxID=6604 RepID=A0ABY7G0A7_MYAAR|nr:uncharacterized protein LOC128220145 [Mya arenaria]WAR27660.1 hypothetical protein MAR_013364 [Mya arenaria]
MAFMKSVWFICLLIHVCWTESPPTTVEVTLNVFSGRPDPDVVLQPNDDNYDVIVLNAGQQSTDLPPVMGYKGFTIMEYHGLTLSRTSTVGRCTRPDFELLLLNSITGKVPKGDDQPISDSLLNYARSDIENCAS